MRPEAYGESSPKSSPRDLAAERKALLAWLDEKCDPGASVTDTYEGWIASRRHHGDTGWSHVLRCRALVKVCERHGIEAVLELLRLAADRGWKGLRPEYVASLPRRPQRQPRRRGGVWDQLKEAEDG